MNSDRIQEIQNATAYPESVSVKHALLQVWNECEQEQVKISNIKPCPLCELGHKCKKLFYIPFKDKNGIPIDKVLKVVEGSELHKKLLNGGTKLPMCLIIED